MSTTTTAAPAMTAVEQTLLASLPGLIGMAFAGKLAPVNVTVQTGLVTAGTDAAAEVDELHSKLDTLEASNPLITASIAAFHQIASVLGLALPSEDAVFAGVKAAAGDVLNGLKAPAAA
nr:hypothetical protein [uncultured Lichenicoccus sp.]